MQVGDILQFKKSHPCGESHWKLIATGVICRLECCGCQRIIAVPRAELAQKIKKERA